MRPPLDRIRESIFSVLGGSLEGAHVLDLFAGSGAFGLEAVSRGARKAIFVDTSRECLRVLRQNITNLGFAARCEVVQGDGLSRPDLRSLEPPGFRLIFMDPPFRMLRTEGDASRVLGRVEEILTHPLALGERGCLVLRAPERFEGPTRLAPDDSRVYGASRVFFFRRAHL